VSVAGSYTAKVVAQLRSLKAGLGATAAGVFDGARALLHASTEGPEDSFWRAFREISCFRDGWADHWDRDLLVTGFARVECGCGRHAVATTLFNRRWILIVLADVRALNEADRAIVEAIEILKNLLPAGSPSGWPRPPGGAGGGGQGPAELGISVGWIRDRAARN